MVLASLKFLLDEGGVMRVLRSVIRSALQAAKTRSAGELIALGNQVRDTFNSRLGGVDVFGTEQKWSGSLLRTIVDQSGITITYHVGGTLLRLQESGSEIQYEVVDGSARAFKFMPHPETQVMGKNDFFGVGFPYRPDDIALSKITGGTIARVKGDARRIFFVDAISRVTDRGIEDLRFYPLGCDFAEKIRIIFEETVSGRPDEWDRTFRLLNF